MGVIVYFRAMLKKIQIFFPEFWFGKRNVPFSDFTWYYMHLFVRFSQFQNYHTNMKRLDMTLTKFIKLHDCIPVNVRFAVYTPNFLSLNGMSWYKSNYYTEDPFRTHPLLVQLPPRERGMFFMIMVVFSLRISTLFCF